MRLYAILQAFQVSLQFPGLNGGQGIDHPILMPRGIDHALPFQVAEMLGDLHLRLIEHFLQMTDAERSFSEQIQDPQARLIAKALVNLN